MRNTFLTIAAILISSACFAQNNLITTPEKPHPGEVVKFTYTPPADLANEKEPLQCTVYIMGNYDDFYGDVAVTGKPVEMEIKKAGNSYSGEVKTENTACGLLFCFSWGSLKIDRKGVCTSGKLDNNNKKGYFVPFYTADNKPCPTAYARMGKYLSDPWANSWRYKNLPLAREYYEKEMENYPEKSSSIAYDIYNKTYDAKTDSAERRNFAVKQLEIIFGKKPTTDADYIACNTFFNALGLKKTGAYYRQYAAQHTIGNYFLASNLYGKMKAETDLTKKRVLLDSSIVCFKGMDFYMRFNTSMAGGFFTSFVEDYLVAAYKTGDKKTFDEALRYIQHDINCGFEELYPYMTLADAAIELKKYDEALAFCNTWSSICEQKYMQLKNKPASYKPSKSEEEYSTKEDIRLIAVWNLVEITKKQALIYTLKGDCANAQSKLNEVHQYATWPEAKEMGFEEKDLKTDLLSILTVMIPLCQPLDEAIKSMEGIIRDGKYDETTVTVVKELYVKKNGSDKGFTEYLLGLKKTDDTEMVKNLETMKANEEAPDFTLVDMDGKQIKLSSLKGKTVILDFWATWCGPCRASFPAMQQLVDYYKTDPNIVFLFIDTFEGKTGGTTVDKMKVGAKKLMDEKKYSFQVVFDAEDVVAKKYNVTGIPAKFVIDKTGTIRYKALGSGIFSDLVDEMMAMIKAVK